MNTNMNTNAQTQKILHIGVYITIHKKSEINWSEFINYCNENNQQVIINIVDITKDNYNKIKFDKIIAKIDEYYMNNEENSDIINYLTSYPNLIDPICSQFNVGNRYIMAENLVNICGAFSNLFIPKFVYIENKEKSLNYCPNIVFPIIIKPNCCFGTKNAHNMCLVNSYVDLLNVNIEYPCILQQYLPHQKIIFKVYVIGSKYEIVVKNSIDYDGANIIYFNTADIKIGKINFDSKQIKEMIKELTNSVDLNKLNIMISKLFKLSLFGYDIIKSDDGQYGIIDVNYFPGYKNMNKFNEYLFNLILDNQS